MLHLSVEGGACPLLMAFLTAHVNLNYSVQADFGCEIREPTCTT